MRYATFEVDTLVGPVRRIGVVCGENLLLDVQAAYSLLVAPRMDRSRASVVAGAILPADLVSILANGAMARDAIEETFETLGDSATDLGLRGLEGQRIVFNVGEVRLQAPIPRPTSLRDCSAFEQHVRNTAGPRGINELWYEFPIYYKGNPNTVLGTGSDVLWPEYAETLDYELEFAFVIGKQGTNIPEEEAADHIAGYMAFNDVSARDIQMREMRLLLGPAKGKDMDAGNVMGPFLVTSEEFDPAKDHEMIARVNGEEWSRGLTSSIYHSVARIVSYISRSETLVVGDVIGSGTVGRGCGLELGRYPQPGDTVEIEVEGIGVLSNRFVRRSETA